MSLIPILFRDSFMDDFLRPKSFFDGFPADLLEAIDLIPVRRRNLRRWPCVPLNQIGDQEKSKADFEVSIDVQNFKPEEISVKMVDNFITVEGKHEEKRDEEGFVSRHFVRKYLIPEGYDLDKVVSALSSDGVLSIKVPRLAIAAGEEDGKTIQVQKEESDVLKQNQPKDTDSKYRKPG